MITVDASEVGEDVERLWKQVRSGPVTVVSAGQAVAVVLSPDEFAKLTARRHGAKAGFAKDLFRGIDMNALLETSVEDVFEGYL